MSGKILAGVMMFVVVAIMLAALVYSLSQVPTIVSDPKDVGNLSSGGGVLGTSAMNSTQVSSFTTTGSSIGLLVVVLLMMAAAVIVGAAMLFKHYA
jgi:hypothetical protein